MKKTNYLFLALIFIFSCTGKLAAQEVVWSKHIFSAERDGIWDIETDSEGNVLVLGFHEGPLEVDGEMLSHGDGQDFFLVKMDSDGNILWAQTFTGTGFDRGNSLAIDDADQIYVGAHFSTDLDLAGSILSGVGSLDALIFKMDPNGNILWSKTFGGSESDICYGIYWESDELLAVGHFRNVLDIEDQQLTSNGDQDMWIASLDASDGSLNWIKSYGGTGNERLYRVTKGPQGDIFACGYYDGSFSIGSISTSGGGGTDAITIKWTAGGDPLWIVTGTGPGSSDNTRDLVVDDDNNLYVSGAIYDSTYFDGISLIPGSSSDAFLASYDPSGVLRWIRGSQTTGYSGIYGLFLSEDQQSIYGAGTYHNGTGLGGESLQNLDGAAIGLTEFDIDGVWQRTLLYDGPQEDYALPVGRADADLLLGASFEGSIMLDPGVSYTGAGDSDVLILRVNPDDWTLVSAGEVVKPDAPEVLWDMERAELLISLPVNEGNAFIWSADGKMIAARSLNEYTVWSLGRLPQGLYYVSIQTAGGVFSKAFFVP